MLAIVGDIHGEFDVFAAMIAQIPARAPVLQVGDFGWWPELRSEWDRAKVSRPVWFLDGNHDHVPKLLAGENDWPCAQYVSRGTVLELDGRCVLCLGGALSVDRAWREENSEQHGWFAAEIPSEANVEAALTAAERAGRIDLMVTHTPPDWMIRKHFSPSGLRSFGHDPATWRDLAAERVERVWRAVGEPPLFCGHMHRPTVNQRCRILGIHEIAVV